MRNAAIIVGIIWIVLSASVPMLQSWEMGSSINSIASEQLAELEK